MLTKTVPLFLQEAESHPQARVCAACEVRRSALFGALDLASLERIHAHIGSPSLPAEAMLYGRGRQGDAVYTIRSGIVRFERVSESGERRIVRVAGRGDLIGQEALLRRRYMDDAVACTPVEVCRIPATLVDHLGEAESALLHELMRRWHQALEEAEAWSADLSTGPARRRMLKLLAVLVRHADEHGMIWLPQRDQIGDMLGIALETASRLVSQLKRDGVLELLSGGRARLDPDRLDAALDDACQA